MSSNHKDQPFEMLHFLFFWHGHLACCNLVAENTIFKSSKTQIKTHHTKPMFWATTFTTNLDSMQYKNNGWENDLIVQSSISMIFKTKIYARNIPKICLKNPLNLSRTSSKSIHVLKCVWNFFGTVNKLSIESSTIWVSFLKVPNLFLERLVRCNIANQS